jgi:hypothetical protein
MFLEFYHSGNVFLVEWNDVPMDMFLYDLFKFCIVNMFYLSLT